MRTIFKAFIEFVKRWLLLFMVFVFFFFDRKACGILAPRAGIKPASSAPEGEIATTRPPVKSQPAAF